MSMSTSLSSARVEENTCTPETGLLKASVPLCRKLQSEAKPTRTSAAKEIAAASVVAAAEIYESMYAGAMTVMKSGGSTTADFVGHK